MLTEGELQCLQMGSCHVYRWGVVMFTNGERAMFTDGELQCLQWGSCKLQCLQRGSSNVYRGVVAKFSVGKLQAAMFTEGE